MAEEVTLTELPGPAIPGVEIALLDIKQICDQEDAASSRFLVGEELRRFAGFCNNKRRREWLAARICIKLMLVRSGFLANIRDCRILQDVYGRPYIANAVGGREPLFGMGDCSLSHKGRFACACVCRHPSIRVGIDIEEISPRLRNIRSTFVNPLDTPRLADSEDADLTLLWTLKEAYSKAVGIGISIGFHNLICDHDPETGMLGVRTLESQQAQVEHSVYKGHVIGVCFIDASIIPSAAEQAVKQFSN